MGAKQHKAKKWQNRTLREAEKLLKLKNKSITGIYDEAGDWQFVLRICATLESLCKQRLVRDIKGPILKQYFRKNANLSTCLQLIRKSIPEKQEKMRKAVSEDSLNPLLTIRNAYVHRIENIQMDLRTLQKQIQPPQKRGPKPKLVSKNKIQKNKAKAVALSKDELWQRFESAAKLLSHLILDPVEKEEWISNKKEKGTDSSSDWDEEWSDYYSEDETRYTPGYESPTAEELYDAANGHESPVVDDN